MKKKIVALMLCAIMLLLMMQGVSAAKVGDVIDQAVYTDIVAKINNHDIASFNINGYTAVIAEDLVHYGFNVRWAEAERALYITKSNSTTITSTYIAPIVSSSQVGKKAYNVLYTDIKTYVNGKAVTSYNISGRTIIYINDLADFGSVSWNEASRIISLTLKEDITTPAAITQGTYYPGTTIPTYTSITGIPLKRTFYLDNGQLVYVYNHTKYGEYSEMIDYAGYFMRTSGWIESPLNNDDTSTFSLGFINASAKEGVLIMYKSNEVYVALTLV